MENLERLGVEYWKKLTERSKKSKVYQSHQLTGLLLAELLEDRTHKALYMKLAKQHDADHLLQLAKQIAENGEIRNKGAYFMRMLTS